jgi:large subunit ribosomal protein L13
MKTFMANADLVERKWHLIDANDLVLGRLATKLAMILRGKDKAIYRPDADLGDYVVVINAEKIRVTGNKLKDKMYYRHSGRPGGLKETALEKLLATHPTRAIEFAVKGMLPKNSMGRAMIKKLKIYAGNEHPHTAQQPQPVEL